MRRDRLNGWGKGDVDGRGVILYIIWLCIYLTTRPGE